MAAGVPLDGISASIVVVVLFGYVFLSLFVEIIFHKLHHRISHYKRPGALMEVFEKVKDEIMLVGVLTMVLLLAEDRVVEICIEKACHGIPNTRAACDISVAVSSSASSNSSASRRMLLGAGSGPAVTCQRFQGCCDSNVIGFEDSSVCPDSSQTPFISLKALHDIHFYIFIIMMVHIGVTMLVMYLATKRVHSWSRFETFLHADGITKPSRPTGFFSSCHKQLHENVDAFCFVAIKNYFIAKHQGELPNNSPEGFSFHEELHGDLQDGYKNIIGVSSWMWLILSTQLVLKAYVFDFAYGNYASILLILIAGSKLDRIKSKMTVEIFDAADTDKSGTMSEEEFAALQTADATTQSALVALEPDFWRNDPNIILTLIRVVIWLNSTEIGTTLYFIFWTGFDGCYVKQRTWAWILGNLCVTLLVAGHCSLNVIPLFSLTSNLGSHKQPADLFMTAKMLKHMEQQRNFLKKGLANASTSLRSKSMSAVLPEPSSEEDKDKA